MKRVIKAADKIYLSKEEKQEFLDTVDMEPLFDEIRRRLGVSDISFNHEIKEIRHRGNEPYMTFTSSNIADQCGVLSQVMESVTLESFNSSVSANSDETYLWITIHFSWKFKDGGSNGTDYMTAWCFGGRDWKFR